MKSHLWLETSCASMEQAAPQESPGDGFHPLTFRPRNLFQDYQSRYYYLFSLC